MFPPLNFNHYLLIFSLFSRPLQTIILPSQKHNHLHPTNHQHDHLFSCSQAPSLCPDNNICIKARNAQSDIMCTWTRLRLDQVVIECPWWWLWGAAAARKRKAEMQPQNNDRIMGSTTTRWQPQYTASIIIITRAVFVQWRVGGFLSLSGIRGKSVLVKKTSTCVHCCYCWRRSAELFAGVRSSGGWLAGIICYYHSTASNGE